MAVSFAVGQTVVLMARFMDKRGRTAPVAGVVGWSIFDTTVAAVQRSIGAQVMGVEVLAKKVGSTTITCTGNANVSGSGSAEPVIMSVTLDVYSADDAKANSCEVTVGRPAG